MDLKIQILFKFHYIRNSVQQTQGHGFESRGMHELQNLYRECNVIKASAKCIRVNVCNDVQDVLLDLVALSSKSSVFTKIKRQNGRIEMVPV